jgi:hypothetical protein
VDDDTQQNLKYNPILFLTPRAKDYSLRARTFIFSGGHVFQENQYKTDANFPCKMFDVIIVGAGSAGLTAVTNTASAV